ncbi:hypothetical protein K443DRAFT_413454 [Laccaria amethystina LaAM-08-1]|uniref:Uncharacterized protein n=1 Tax=Laccaria amethystina LaAM-08-1 TaxID=1095629 RepID=A0A0C9WPX4_9AGAR|nr:hypothetical protein K443DRAFT_413454 [Laccaria amethystina LaAM-08-1]
MFTEFHVRVYHLFRNPPHSYGGEIHAAYPLHIRINHQISFFRSKLRARSIHHYVLRTVLGSIPPPPCRIPHLTHDWTAKGHSKMRPKSLATGRDLGRCQIERERSSSRRRSSRWLGC